MYKKQSGITLISLLATLSVLAIIVPMGNQLYNEYQDEVTARSLGARLAMIANAQNRYIVENGIATPAGVYADLNFLRSQDCGGPAGQLEGYLPCNFANQLRMQLSPQTTIINNAGAVVINTSYGAPTDPSGQVNFVMAGIIAAHANGLMTDAGRPEFRSFVSFTTDDNTGAITASIDNNPKNDVHMRRDGTTDFTGDISFGGNDITNVSNILATLVTADDFQIEGGMALSEVIALLEANGLGDLDQDALLAALQAQLDDLDLDTGPLVAAIQNNTNNINSIIGDVNDLESVTTSLVNVNNRQDADLSALRRDVDNNTLLANNAMTRADNAYSQSTTAIQTANSAQSRADSAYNFANSNFQQMVQYYNTLSARDNVLSNRLNIQAQVIQQGDANNTSHINRVQNNLASTMNSTNNSQNQRIAALEAQARWIAQYLGL